MSDGVRQTGKYFFSFLFAVYLDGLLVELSKSGVGCHWGISHIGLLLLKKILLVQPFSYVDDVVLLTPCTSALRTRVVE